MCWSNRVRPVRLAGAVGSWRERERGAFKGCSRFVTALVCLWFSTMAKVRLMLADFDLPGWQESRAS